MRRLFLSSVFLLACTTGGAEQRDLADADSPRRSVAAWMQYTTPEEAGFSSSALDSIRHIADSVRSGAVMAVYRDHVLLAWGDVAREFQAHSVRKSLLSALYGIAVAEGKVDLDRSLGDLGIDDFHRLTDVEKGARIRDLIAARSGVYLPAAYGSDQDRVRPARGSYPPGTHWFYNNWDFNTAGVIYEQLTGEKLYEAFARRIAAPLGMEDWNPNDGFLVLEPGRSRHPAHTFRISTRDLARFGLLYLHDGKWNGRQIVPAEWVKASTQPISQLAQGAGYGYMWWTQQAGTLPARYPTVNVYDIFIARGTGGQAVFVIPGADLVVVHRGDTDHRRMVEGPVVLTIVEGIAAARRGEPLARPALKPLAAVPLASQAPPLPPQHYLAITPATAARVVGEYEFGAGAVGRVFMHDGRLFMFMPGEGEAELFAVAPDEYTVRVVPGVSIVFEPQSGPVTGVNVRMGERTMRALKK
jgi:CubicO group peptidase (beta-lactamase class C family)